MKNDKSEFIIGDTVTLKSCHLPMTVSQILDDGMVACMWMHFSHPGVFARKYSPAGH